MTFSGDVIAKKLRGFCAQAFLKQSEFLEISFLISFKQIASCVSNDVQRRRHCEKIAWVLCMAFLKQSDCGELATSLVIAPSILQSFYKIAYEITNEFACGFIFSSII